MDGLAREPERPTGDGRAASGDGQRRARLNPAPGLELRRCRACPLSRSCAHFRRNGLRVHAPGAIRHATEKPGQVSFEVAPWLKSPCFILVNGLTRQPRLAINGKQADCSGPNQFLQQEGWLIMELNGRARVEILLQP